MKKRWISALVLPALMLCSCAAPEPAPRETFSQTASTEPREALSLREEITVEEQTWEGTLPAEGFPQGISWNYCLPRILDDTPDARAINREIQQLRRDAENGFLVYDRIRWESHRCGSLLSLVLTARLTCRDDLDYLAYHYDLSTGKALDNSQLLQLLQISPEAGEAALRRAAAEQFDRDACFLYESFGDCFEALASLRAETLSRETTGILSVPLYVDGEGRLHGFGLIGTYAGAGAYKADLILKPEPEVSRTAELDFIRAELQGSTVALTFRSQGTADYLLPPGTVEPGRAYPVEGLYGTYRDLALGYLGNGGEAFLFLLDDTGHVTFCSLTDGIRSGCHFRAVGPLLWPDRIGSFAFSQDEGGFLASAVTESGEVLSLSEPVEQARSLVDLAHCGASWYTEDQSHCLTFRENSRDFTWSAGGGLLARGEINRYLGMTEAGMHYAVRMLTEEGDYAEAVLTRQRLSSYAFPEGTGSMTLTQVSGPPLSGLPENGQAILTASLY